MQLLHSFLERFPLWMSKYSLDLERWGVGVFRSHESSILQKHPAKFFHDLQVTLLG
jgi:hypothetical protein